MQKWFQTNIWKLLRRIKQTKRPNQTNRKTFFKTNAWSQLKISLKIKKCRNIKQKKFLKFFRQPALKFHNNITKTKGILRPWFINSKTLIKNIIFRNRCSTFCQTRISRIAVELPFRSQKERIHYSKWTSFFWGRMFWLFQWDKGLKRICK